MECLLADVDLIKKSLGTEPYQLAVILGSGFGDAVVCDPLAPTVRFGDLQGASVSPISGHAGCISRQCIEGRQVLVFQGRFHCYQGLSARQAAYPARIASALEVSRLLITSAVGGISADMTPGTFVLLRDHINLLGDNPLVGELPPRFVDLTNLYCQNLFSPLSALSVLSGRTLRRGVLAALPGPSYETPAEIEMLRRLGADVVSMSMVPEAIMARAEGMEVTGLVLVTNLAAGLSSAGLDHRDVLTAGESSASHFSSLLNGVVENWC